MHIQHDISHCRGGECPLRETCYRYKMHQDLLANPGKYGKYHSYFVTTPHNYGKCKHYWDAGKEVDHA